MEITPINSHSSARTEAQAQVRQHQKAQETRQAQQAEKATLADSDKLKAALSKTPEVRADKVAKAKALVADQSYPSDTTLSKVAGLMADNFASVSSASSVNG